jgi:predicted metal-dependent HD superfamily phosphohydrolase
MHRGAEPLSVDDLSSRWDRDVLTSAPSSSAAAGVAVLDEVVAHHREPVRRYHTLDHVAAVLTTIDELLADPRTLNVKPDSIGCHVQSSSGVTLAGWLHDVIYDPTRHDNEARSAAFAEEHLARLGVAEATIATTSRLILMTATHDVADDDAAACVLADADLAILGAPPAIYDRYAADIRAEYAHVPDDLFTAGRLAVLQSLVERPRLFHTDLLHTRLDAPARANLSREIGHLRTAAAP